MNVLVVDDVPLNRKLVRIGLEERGMQVFEAENGRLALDLLATRHVDLVVSDVLMPVMGGYGLCRAIRADPRWTGLPVVLLTSTFRRPEDRDLAERAGANAWLTKPLPMERLLEAIREAIATPAGLAGPADTEDEIMREYSEALVTKLDARTAQLEMALEQSRTYAEALAALNAGLEVRVEERTAELTRALRKAQELRGLIPICAYCKDVRDGEDDWQAIESFIASRAGSQFTHGICPECLPRVEDGEAPWRSGRD